MEELLMSGMSLAQVLDRTRDLELACRAAVLREQELEEMNERLRQGYQHSLERTVDLKRSHRRLERAVVQLLIGVVDTMEARLQFMRGHSARVGALARRLALRAGLTRQQAETVGLAGRLHDLGKVSIPETVMGLPGPLGPEDRELIRRHPVLGAQIVSPLECMAEVALIVRHHHERHDGSGYPDGLRYEAIPIGARMVALADRYDALVSSRPHRPALDEVTARARLRAEAGHELDPELTALFLAQLADHPLELEPDSR
jgi:putative nucleotidyltransferase with HDIG domain